MKGITKKSLMEQANFGTKTFVDKKEASTESNVIGICKTKKGNYMVYMTNDAGKKFKTSVHAKKVEANEMVLRRLQEV